MKIVLVGPAREFDVDFKVFKRFGASVLTRAMCLDQALESLESYDGAVCAQAFPTHIGRESEPVETMSGNWAALANRCRELALPFVLIVRPGDYNLAERFNRIARENLKEWAAFALVAPVDMEFVAQTVCTAAKHGRAETRAA